MSLLGSAGDILGKFDAGELIGLVAVVGGIFFVICCTVAENWRKVRQSELDAALKQDMLNRGMSGEDIAKVIGASARKNKDKRCG